jgi:Flp pilus assembly protein TadG
MSAVGCAVDYSMASRIKAKLQSAADAASIAAIAQKSPGYIAAAKDDERWRGSRRGH